MNSSAPSHEGVAPDEPTASAPRRFASRLPTVHNALLEAKKPLTVPEIAEATNCSLITVRRHLDSLRRAGRVCVTGQRARLDAEGNPLPSRRGNEYAAV